MRRSLSSRVLSLALALWLPLFMTGSEWVVQCPTHGGVASAAHEMSGSATASHDHDADHSAPMNHQGGHQCSCPGPGCCPPAVAVVPGELVPMAHVVAIHEARAVSTLELLSSRRDHVLPFATAPPVA